MNARPFTVLVVGGYGVFGRSICRMLAQRHAVRVIVAGRSRDKAEDAVGAILAAAPGADIEALAFDKATGLAEALRESGARLLIDAAGPFQGQDYSVAETCIAAGVHYIDLADAREFVVGFDRLDRAARSAGVLAVSGASSVPGLSSAAIDHLTRDLKSIDDIAIAIAPGNRAPRGLAVVSAILGYVGQRFPRRRGGAFGSAHGWQDLRRVHLRLPGGTDLGRRWVAACDVPDNVLFPGRYTGVGSVDFRAGLELGIMHFGLWALSWPVRWRWIRSLAPLAPLALRLADLLLPWGSDRGGMVVEISGTAPDWSPRRRRWTLIAEGGHGPQVPAVPATILAGKLAQGWALTGATPCLGLFDLAEFEQAVAGLEIHCATEELDAPLFRRVLGARYLQLPAQLQEMHDGVRESVATGEAEITRGRSVVAGIIGRIARLPAAGADVPTEVVFTPRDGRESWRRVFGRSGFRTTLEACGRAPGHLIERLGPMAFRLEVPADANGLSMILRHMTVFGIPVPRALWPRITASERVVDGLFAFDVSVSAPVGGLIIRYRGRLRPPVPADRPPTGS